MARINIDEQFWLDLADLSAEIGDSFVAAGQAIRFIRHSQQKHKAGKLVSEDEFKRKKFHEALIGIFAERVAGGIQAIGAEKHFDWLKKKVEAGRAGGIKSGEARAIRPKHREANEANEANESKTEQAEPSPSPSCSPSSSASPSCESSAGAREAPPFDELVKKLPIVSMDLMRAKARGKGEGWLEEQLHEAYVYHQADPARAPRSPGQWAKKFQSWVLEEGRRRGKPEKAKLDLSHVKFDDDEVAP